MNTQHTPGPWAQAIVDSANINIRAGSASVALVYRHQGSPVTMDRHDEGDANARLIAAAPELLEALNAMLAAMNNSKQWANMEFAKQADDAKRLARAAIAKATQP